MVQKEITRTKCHLSSDRKSKSEDSSESKELMPQASVSPKSTSKESWRLDRGKMNLCACTMLVGEAEQNFSLTGKTAFLLVPEHFMR